MTEKKIIELLESGDFTIAYHDNGQGGLYKGHYFDYDDLPEKADCEFDYSDSEGYMPLIVQHLTKALGGKSYSI